MPIQQYSLMKGHKQCIMLQEQVDQIEDSFVAVQVQQEAAVMNASREMASSILSFECKF